MQLPPLFLSRMQTLLGEELAAFLAAYERPLRRGLRVNTLKLPTAAFRSLSALPLEPAPFSPDSFYLDTPHKAGSDPLHHAGAYYMQEPSACSAVSVLAPQPGERVLDLCAAPGGKSGQIAAALQNTGLLWSNEYVPARARILQQNLERLGVRRGVVSCSDTGRLCAGLTGWFDAVLVDAPCSGEGMFRKEPQALDGWSLDNIHLCAARQQEILQNAAAAVRPGGRLVYSTCTFAPEENEGVIAAFLQQNPDFSLQRIAVPWGCSGFPAQALRAFLPAIAGTADLTACRRILPQHGGEGHFIALLRRDGNTAAPLPVTYEPPKNDPHSAAAADLYAGCFRQPPEGVFVTHGELVRLLPPELPALTGLGVLSAGIATAQVCKNRLEPCHAAFMAAAPADCHRVLELPPDSQELAAFLHGAELPCAGENGWTAVATAGLTTGFGKCAGGRLKNRYPKGLRLL